MCVTELDTFVQKFHQLWKAGHIAHLDVDTYAGKAWVGLRVQLGHVPGPPHHQFRPPPFSQVHKRKDTPSRQRRRARRTAARQVNIAEEAANTGSVNESVEEPDSSKTDVVIENTRKEAENATIEEIVAAETEKKEDQIYTECQQFFEMVKKTNIVLLKGNNVPLFWKTYRRHLFGLSFL